MPRRNQELVQYTAGAPELKTRWRRFPRLRNGALGCSGDVCVARRGEENWSECASGPLRAGMLLCAARQCGRVWVCGADAPTSWCGFWSGDKSLRLEVGFEIVDLGFQFRSRKLPVLGCAAWQCRRGTWCASFGVNGFAPPPFHFRVRCTFYITCVRPSAGDDGHSPIACAL